MKFSSHRVLFYIARHGQTTLNAEDRFRGPLNIDLDKQGRSDAHQLADFFQPLPLSKILTSDRNRTIETSMIVGERKNLTPEITPELRALDVGHLGGQLKTKDTEREVLYHYQNPNIPFNGGGSFNDFRQRIHPVFGQALHIRMQTGIPPLLVAHASVMHEASAVFNKNHMESLAKPGGVVAILKTRSGVIKSVPVFKAEHKPQDLSQQS